MKIQCGCGTKYSFEITPEMARSPIRFICQNCSQDSSELVNQLIRQQLGLEAAAAAVTAAAPSVAVAPRAAAAVAVPVAARVAAPAASPVAAAGIKAIQPQEGGPGALRVSVAAGSPGENRAAAVAGPEPCTKHTGQLTTDRCRVCQRPICPKCMELFGFVCSAYCKGKAEDRGLDLPVFAGQRDVARSRQWRKVGRAVTLSLLVVAAVLGAWIWYAWVGSVPQLAFSAKFSEPGHSGRLLLCGSDQLVFLHGGRLGRHDIKEKKEIWSNELIDKKRIAADAAVLFERMQAEWKASWSSADATPRRIPTLPELTERMEEAAASGLQLHVCGENIWVASLGRLVRYDWQTGKSNLEVPIKDPGATLVSRADELLFISENEDGRHQVTRVSLVSGESKGETIGGKGSDTLMAERATRPGGVSGRVGPGAAGGARGLSGDGQNKGLDPAAVAAKVQNLPMPAKLALPAVLAANANQQRALAEMKASDDRPAPPTSGPRPPRETLNSTSLFPGKNGMIEVSARLLESKIVERKVMKDAPKKSALEGDVNAAATTAIANEILNEIQRDAVGDIIRENISRYQVTLRRPGAKDISPWTGEVTGMPEMISQPSVEVMVAGKSILVFDQNNKKLWQAEFTYYVQHAAHVRFGFSATDAPYGEGPCVERGDSLYVYDEGMLTAFELATGNVRWRLPSVGTTGMFFDDDGMIYLNTTTATPEKLKYSRQIDVTDRVRPLVLKIDPKTGRTLWRAEHEGLVSYIYGKFVYTTDAHPGEDTGDDDIIKFQSGLEIPPHVQIKRLDAKNGRVLWRHYERRAPLDVQFHQKSFQLLFADEMQVLKFFSL